MKYTDEGKRDNNNKSVIEALLFVSEKPLMIEQIRQVLDDLDSTAIRTTLEELRAEYLNSRRGVNIVEVAGGFQMVTAPELAVFLKRFFQKGPERLSRPSLETLSIVAYKQPVTRIEIESIRGVDSSGIVKNLINKGLLRNAGRRKSPGRPFVYVTTRQFLEYFGLKSLEDLPKVEEFTKVEANKDEFRRATPQN